MATALERLQRRVQTQLPGEIVHDVFTGSIGASPTLRTFAAVALTVLWVVFYVVILRRPAVVGVIMLFPILVLSVFITQLLGRRVVAITDHGAVLLGSGSTAPILGRYPPQLTVHPYWDDRWLRVEIGDVQLWASKRMCGEIVWRYAPTSTT